ncbi:ATP-binding protein [Olsenella uli]|uniref:ATP-binding protein n=1 Tax=Olsenella uli TaxID=133926 RepID=UPI0028D8DEB1|nr:ATP-binding protein [Olsenella uli]
MAREIRAKLVTRLREQGTSRGETGRTRHMPMGSVCEAFGLAEERHTSWRQLEPMTDEEAYRLFYPDGHVRESVFEEPGWAYAHKGMAEVGANLELLHDERRGGCRRDGLAATEGPDAKVLKKCARHELPVVDEWLTEGVDDVAIRFLPRLVERRYMDRSTVLCAQYAPADRHGGPGGGVQADAMADRLVHGAVRIDLGEVDVRRLPADKRKARA